MQLGLKELRETAIWLEYLNELSRTTPERKLPIECGELVGIFVSSIKTARGRKSQ